MVVQHNLTAINSNRMLGITTKSQSKSTEKLSSGYKINRAADDAAGLAISEKMRKQIRGLTQASLNAQDGISAVQTAEGALTEVHDMIQRMSELAVKAANGTNDQEERDYIQLEIDELINEIDRVSETTKFNSIYLLKGSDGTDTTYSYIGAGIGAATGVTLYGADGKEVEVTEDSIEAAVASGKYFTAKKGDGEQTGTGNSAVGTTLADYVTWDAGESKVKYKDPDNKVLYDANGDKIEEANLGNYFQNGGGSVSWAAGTPDSVYTGVTADTAAAADESSFATVEAKQLYDEDGNAVDVSKIYDDEGNFIYEGTLYSDNGQQNAIDPDTDLDTYITSSTSAAALKFSLHVGAESAGTNKITLNIKAMSAKGIGVDGLSVKTEDSATAAIDELNEALRIVSEQRAKLGAIQNRLEHTINNLDNVVENTTAAESQIRDTDMATEMVRYSNNNILAQAGQAMLAQSNQANQGVLSLLG